MKIVLLILLTITMNVAIGQTTVNSLPDNRDKNFKLAFNQEEFGDRFCVFYSSDENSDYYVIDLTKLESRFERIYFFNLTYEEQRIINIDADIDKDQTWFKTYEVNKEEYIACLFNDLKEKAHKASGEMTSEQKSAWLMQNNKFKKSAKDE